MLKQYLLFYGDQYYPSGGWSDFQGSFDTEEEALRYCDGDGIRYDWIQIINRESGETVFPK